MRRMTVPLPRTPMRVCAVALIAALLPLTSGCAGPFGAGTGSSSAGPSFSGPWAEDFRREYDEAREQGNTFAQEVLRDGRITEAEATETMDRYQSCMADSGFTLDYVMPDGSSQMSGELTDDERTRYNKADVACGSDSGSRWITGLYNAVNADPDGSLSNRSDEEARRDLADCLERKGAVDDGFTAEDIPETNASGNENYEFMRQFTEPGGRYHDERSADVLTQCLADPRA